MEATITLSASVASTARVLQASTMFDHPPTDNIERTWNVHLPIEEQEWSVGLIVGPSGAGKSSVARECFTVRPPPKWRKDVSVLDDFPKDMGIRDIVDLLTSVGLGSTPAWLRPHRTLSTGEQFRAECARQVAEAPDGEIIVIDEFTSVVDRQVAQIASHTLGKTVRRAGRQFVAVTCHYDVVDWLQPDWIYQPHADTFTWRSVQPRPSLDVGIYPVDRAAWRVFGPHHYLSAYHHPAAQAFGAFVDDQCVAFCSYRHFQHPNTRNLKLGHRLVVLPDWQGLGIGVKLNEVVAESLYQQGFRFRAVVAHPAMIRVLARSPRWRLVAHVSGPGELRAQSKTKRFRTAQSDPRRLNTYSFEYAPPNTASVNTNTAMAIGQ